MILPPRGFRPRFYEQLLPLFLKSPLFLKMPLLSPLFLGKTLLECHFHHEHHLSQFVATRSVFSLVLKF